MAVNFEENQQAFMREDGTKAPQCECMFYAVREDSPAWLLYSSRPPLDIEDGLDGMGISVGIELLQRFFRKGFADVDDVIHNALGCASGCLGWWIFRRGVKWN